VGKDPVAVKVLVPDPPLAEIVREKSEFKLPDKLLDGVVIESALDIVNTAAFEVAVLVVEFIELVTTTV
jgi:hypothetical protein